MHLCPRFDVLSSNLGSRCYWLGGCVSLLAAGAIDWTLVGALGVCCEVVVNHIEELVGAA